MAAFALFREHFSGGAVPVFPALSLDAHDPYTGLFLYGFSMCAGLLGSYDSVVYYIIAIFFRC